MVVHHPHQRDDVRAARQGIGKEAAAEGARPVGEAGGGEPRPGPLGHGRQVEQHQPQPRRGLTGRGQEGTLAAADVEEAAVAAERIGGQDLGGDHRLRRRHQGAVVGDRVRRGGVGPGRARVGPVAHQLGLAGRAAQQRHGVGEIGVEQGVMLDHRRDARIVDDGRTQLAQPVAPAAAARDQAQRHGRGEQALGGIGG